MAGSQRKRRRLPAEPVEALIESMAHDGRGVARVDGKTVFVHGALPGERVRFRYLARNRRYDTGETLEVLEPAAQRVQPFCRHAARCGGCSLQHLAPEAQVEAKQAILLEQLVCIGKVRPAETFAPLRGPERGYRRKARLGVRDVAAKGRVLVGFRERGRGYIAELESCPVLHPVVGERLAELAALIGQLSLRREIPQIEVAVGDSGAALVFRTLGQPSAEDCERLAGFGRSHGLRIFLQPAGPDHLVPLWPVEGAPELSYALHDHDLEIAFRPTDFTQVNAEINRGMIARALELLDVRPGERVLDLYCGLGNFTLPLARRAGAVLGVEGDAALVERARDNARRNGIDNAEFRAADLAGELGGEPWLREPYSKLLLDPPRSGAQELLRQMSPRAERLVYVSCNPATLARDAGILVSEHGYRLRGAGVLDMFPHTSHVESIALFERD